MPWYQAAPLWVAAFWLAANGCRRAHAIMLAASDNAGGLQAVTVAFVCKVVVAICDAWVVWALPQVLLA